MDVFSDFLDDNHKKFLIGEKSHHILSHTNTDTEFSYFDDQYTQNQS